MEPIHIRVGANLERIRKQRGLSLDRVAELTGVSRGMLHQIERGDSQPTITTVWKIATGLHLSFSALINDEEAAVSVVSAGSVPAVTEDEGRCTLLLLFPFDPQTRVEMYTIHLQPHAHYVSSPHNAGVQEYITVTTGTFRLQLRGDTYVLPQGDAIRFSGNVPHAYANDTDEETVLQVVMYYGES